MREIGEESGECQAGVVERGFEDFPIEAHSRALQLELEGFAVFFKKIAHSQMGNTVAFVFDSHDRGAW